MLNQLHCCKHASLQTHDLGVVMSRHGYVCGHSRLALDTAALCLLCTFHPVLTLLLLLPSLFPMHLLLLALQLQDRTAELTLQVQQYSKHMEEALRRMSQLQQE
jgi:hypothetical protein